MKINFSATERTGERGNLHRCGLRNSLSLSETFVLTNFSPLSTPLCILYALDNGQMGHNSMNGRVGGGGGCARECTRQEVTLTRKFSLAF